MNLWIRLSAGNFLTDYGHISFSRRTLLHIMSVVSKSKRSVSRTVYFEIRVLYDNEQ